MSNHQILMKFDVLELTLAQLTKFGKLIIATSMHPFIRIRIEILVTVQTEWD